MKHHPLEVKITYFTTTNMRTYIFKNYIEDKHAPKFLPMQTIDSEKFGRTFMIDIGFHFISAASFADGSGYHEDTLDYVENWVEWDEVDVPELLDIYRKLCWQQWQDDKDKAHTEMCEYMEAVENGEIHFL